MQAIVLEKTGGIENLKQKEVELRELKPNEIKVKVAHCGVCYRDIIDRRGGFPFIRLPIIPGHELSGEVVAVGAEVKRLKPKMKVVSLLRGFCGKCRFCQAKDEVNCEQAWEQFGLTIDGGYAPFVIAPENCFYPAPEELPTEIAASLLCTAGTAYRALQLGRLERGERVVVTGASGGVGVAALQIIKILGGQPIAITSSPSKVDFLKRWTEEVIVAKDGRFDKKVRGVDLVLEITGPVTLEGSLKCLRTKGRVVLIGNVTGERYPLNPGIVILRELEIIGSHTANGRVIEKIAQWIKEEKYEHLVSEILPLKEASRAHQLLEERQVRGRVVLNCGEA